MKTASQTVVDHLINGTSIEAQLDALIAEGTSFGPYFNLTPADAEAMFQCFQLIKPGNIKASWLNDTALKLILEVLSTYDADIAIIDSISIDSSQWEPPWQKQPDLVLIPVHEGDHWILVRIDIAQLIIVWALQEVLNVSCYVVLLDFANNRVSV